MPARRWWHGGAKYLSLRRGLVLLIIAALLPITVLSILQGLVRLENRRAVVIRQLSNNVDVMAGNNQMLLTSTRALLQVSATNPVLRDGSAGCGDILKDVKAISPAYANLTRYDADGNLLCAAVRPPGHYQITHRKNWEAIKQSDGVFVSEAMTGALTGKRIMTMALPMRGADGSFQGSINAAIDLRWLERRLQESLSDKATGVAIISDSGHIITSSGPLPRFDPALASGTVGRTRDASGTSWSYTLVPLVQRTPTQPGIRVAYAAPDPPRFSLVWWQTIVDFTLPVAAILLASLAIWFGAQRLVLRWLLGLQRLALHFAGGDYRRRPVSFAEAPREIRSVAASLYRMSGAVNERDRQLRDSLERQRLLARELHHRVKNNFQMVMSLLSLQSSRLADGDARQAIDQARRRIGALALVHHQLYDTGELATISSRALLGALCQQLQPPAGSGIALDCEFDDVPLDIDSAVPLTLWFVETVNNALQHGFPPPRNGQVEARFSVTNGKAELTIRDDGIGIEEVLLEEGQGLRLMRALATQLGGTASLAPQPGGGAIASLNFQLKPAREPIPLAGVLPASH